MKVDRMNVEFKEDDLKRIIYWIICKFKEDEYHHQASSTKRDLIGGFIDRWFNRAPELLIFRELLKNNEYDVVVDNFLSGQDTKKNAPDIIGLQKKNNIIKFAYFKDGEWITVENMPVIEVKTFRKTQSLVAVGNTQMNSNHYYVFVESHIREDYLTTLFKESVFDEEIRESLIGSEEFIASDINDQIIPLPKLGVKKDLGYFKLLGIFKGDTVQKYSIRVSTDEAGRPEKPRYFAGVEKYTGRMGGLGWCGALPTVLDEGIFRENNNWVPFYIKYIEPDSTVHLLKKLKTLMISKMR